MDLNTLTKSRDQIDLIYRQVYSNTSHIELGWPRHEPRVDLSLRRPYTAAVIGGAFGDEGKGRTVVNLIHNFFSKQEIKKVYVVRFQGGNNAGHSLEMNGIKWAQHQVPSGIHLPSVYGIMDSGMVIHAEDLMTEYLQIERVTKSNLKGKLFVSNTAVVCSDLDRAKEIINRFLNSGAKGGTGRGIGPAYAGYYDRQSLLISDLTASDWRQRFSKLYKNLDKLTHIHGFDLSQMEVPDFAATKAKNKSCNRTVGSLQVFIDRLAQARKWLLGQKLVTNTFVIHQQIFDDAQVAVLFEGAQSVGLDAWLGTYPDVTASNTTLYGIQPSTKFWKQSQVWHRIAVIKATYTSSVGERQMPTQIDLPFPITKKQELSSDQQWADYVRTEAHEFGTTTGRPRDIQFIDLGLIGYNVFMGGVEALVATHMDIARAREKIKVCWGYRNLDGEVVAYQPGLIYQQDLIPQYIELPSWDGKKVMKAKSIAELPEDALRYLSFLQHVLGVPIVAITTGSKEHDYITFPGYL